MLTQKQKTLILECIEHFQEWESHMGRFNEPKQKELLFGLKPITVYVPTKKMVALNNIKDLLNVKKLPVDLLEDCKRENEKSYYGGSI